MQLQDNIITTFWHLLSMPVCLADSLILVDDLAESFMMSAFHNGVLRTQKAHYMNE